MRAIDRPRAIARVVDSLSRRRPRASSRRAPSDDEPGATFACYEWCLTDKYDGSAFQKKIKKDIEVGDGLPDLVHTSVCTQALRDAGFEIVETRDCALDGHLGKGGEPWYGTTTTTTTRRPRRGRSIA